MYRFLETEDPLKAMRDFKLKATPEDICGGDRCSIITKLCQEAYSYDYDSKPRYGVLKFILENELIKLNVIPDNIFSFLQLRDDFVGRICVQSDRNISPESQLGSTSERNSSSEIMVSMGDPSYNFTVKDNMKVMQSANDLENEPSKKESSKKGKSTIQNQGSRSKLNGQSAQIKNNAN